MAPQFEELAIALQNKATQVGEGQANGHPETPVQPNCRGRANHRKQPRAVAIG